MTIRTKKIFFSAASLAVAGLFAAVVVHAQSNDLGVTNFANAAGASVTDIRVIIARIIRVIFGILGVVAVVLVLYGGFLWMTSGGDEEKTATARRLLLNAVIGLAIMLSAFAITQFVISRLLGASGLGGAGGVGGGGRGDAGGVLPGQAFLTRSVSPQGSVPIRNVVLRVIMSDDIDPASLGGNFAIYRKENGLQVEVVRIEKKISGRVLEVTPVASCPSPHESLHCFNADSEFDVLMAFSNRRGVQLTCLNGGRPNCVYHFRTGSLIDIAPPKNVTITSPDEGQSIPVDSLFAVWVRAEDDAGVSYMSVAADGVLLPQVVANPPTPNFVGSTEWDTADISLGRHTLSARAYDVDSNDAASDPVTVNVRPRHCFNRVRDELQGETGIDCGGDCGACGGAACGDAGGCAGGVCEGGLCVELPRIDAVSPETVSSGSFFTISGAFFGDRVGKVAFLGGPDAGDDKEASLCASDSWTDTEITVVVPAGFEPGPVRVIRADERYDDTNDEHGPLLPDVQRGTPQGSPSICSVSPRRVKPGERITISGQGFDNPPSREALYLIVNGRGYTPPQPTEVWESSRIIVVVPRIPLASPADAMIQVRANGNSSNYKHFTVLPPEVGERPLVESITPAAGPLRQYVTLSGTNFGAAAGRVIFSRGTDRAYADADFPNECSNRFWSTTSITVKVPRAYSDGTPLERVTHAVSVVRNDGAASNDVSFTVNNDPLGPGICLLDPDNGPANTRVQIFGERFGNVPGVARFTDNQESVVDGPWRDQRVSNARVPAAAVTGPVTVSVGGPSSNGALFAVGACRSDDSCVVGQHCCGDGVCRLDCESARPVGGFQYRFTTGEIPHLPTIIEAATCDGIGQSPSPYKNTIDACVNSSVVARFSTLMDVASIAAGGTEWVSCNSGVELDRSACGAVVPQGRAVGVGQWSPPGGGAGGHLVELSPPVGNLATNTWYRVTLFSSPPGRGVRSTDGVFLDGDRDGVPGGDYVWYFHTREDASSCIVDHVELSPERAVIEEQGGQVRYVAAAVATNCNQMCEGFAWDWSSDFGGARILDPGPDDAACIRTAQGTAETPPGTHATITASVVEPTGRKSDASELTINFLDPQIIASWPSCTEACVNAEVGARFNTSVDEETITGDTVLMFECTNESCQDFRDPAGVGASPAVIHEVRDGRSIAVGFTMSPPGGRWKNGTYYRVVVRGGATGIKSASGALLAGTNYGADASWVFKVGDSPELCDIAAAEVEPAFGTVRIVGDVVLYRARARGRADACDPAGQPLAATDYSWRWSADPAAVASADFSGQKNILPLTITDAAGRLVRSGPQCSAICTNSGTIGGVPVCGNGVVEAPFEECERGQPGCSDRCIHTGSAGGAACGDGTVRAELGEDCDFGYRCSVSGRSCAGPGADCGAGQGFCAPNGGRACSNTGAACAADRDCGVGGRCAPVGYRGCSDSCVRLGSLAGSSTCGNRDIGDGEDCDDGNTASSDGCSSQCLAEGSRPTPFPVCGNGSVEPGEDCDFGDRRDGDGCSARCLHEGTRACTGARDLNCCGDGLVFVTAEDCDDGNMRSGDGCSAQCLKEGSSARLGFSEATASYCGDSVVDEADQVTRGEECEFTGPTDGRFDPDAYIRSLPPNFSPDERRGSRVGIVTAVTKNRSGVNIPGTAQFTLSCSCTTDASCEDLVAGGGGPAGVGCGSGSCCYPRPTVVRGTLQPRPSESVCRNAFVGAEFDHLMEAGSLNGNVLLLEDRSYVEGGRCRGGTTFLGSDWCIASMQAGVTARATPGGTAAAVNLGAALDPDSRYALLVIGDRNTRDAAPEGVRSVDGVALSGYVLYEFFTGPDICSLDAVQTSWQPVPGNPVQTHWLFNSAANDARDDAPGPLFDTLVDRDKVAYAQGYASRAGGRLEALNPIPGVYAWDWSWSPATGTPRRLAPVVPDGPLATVSVIGAAENGTDSVTARATVTRNILGVSCDPADAAGARRICGAARRCEDQGGAVGGRCIGESRSASIAADVLLCENPWPARAVDGSWEPYVDDARPGRRGTQFSFYYCRDAGDPDRRDDDLPAPRLGPGGNAISLEPVPGAAAALSDLLFPMDCRSPDHDPALCTEGDALGLRVYPNRSHLSPLRWYTAQGFGGRPVAAALDGYDAVRDGRTIYVHAGNKVGDPQLYTNVYVLSYNEGGSAALQRIWTDVQKNFHLNANMVAQNAGICRLSATSTCSSDLDCVGVDNVCDAPKDKLRRDVRRFQDLRDIEAALERHYAVNQRCSISGNRCFTNDDCPAAEACIGSYPDLAAGTFLPGRSASTWPSWQATLGNAVGTALPVDPLNRFAACPEGSDAQTCWNASRSEFACPYGSHAYQYEKNGLGYTASADFEFKICDGGDRDGESCALDADCLGGECNLPITSWQGLNDPASHVTRVGNFDNHWALMACLNQIVGAGAARCGDGVISGSEECEGTESRVEACGGAAGFRRATCNGPGAPRPCTFDRSAACAASACPNGVREAGEACDAGALAGRYGQCATDCHGLADHCGDGTAQAGLETCDLGGFCAGNPDRRCADDTGCRPGEGDCIGATIYGATRAQSCRFDCRAAGPYCGDHTVQSAQGEQCDGNNESRACSQKACSLTASRFCTADRDCPSGESCSRETVQTRTCSGGCRLGAWSACTAAGACGDGHEDAGEACDDGNRNNNDGCTNSCRSNICGDGYVNPAAEGCDDGSRNVHPDDVAEIGRRRAACPYGAVCSFCSTSCISQTVSGGSCGNNSVERPYEICEVGANNASWQRVCVGTGRPCANNADCGGGSCYVYDDSSRCTADCRGACPPSYQPASLSFRERGGGGAYINRFSQTAALDNTNPTSFGVHIPECRINEKICSRAPSRSCMRDEECPGRDTCIPKPVAMDFAFSRTPPLNVVFVVDTSQGMDQRPTPTKLDNVKTALRQAIDGIFDNYGGEVKISIITFSSSNQAVYRDKLWGWTPHTDAEDPKYAGSSSCVEGTDPASCLTPADSDAQVTRRNRATLTTIINQLTAHNTDYGAMGFSRAGQLLQGKSGAKVVIYLSDGESKCGDPATFPRDDAAPDCYHPDFEYPPGSGQTAITNITEPLATKAADDLKDAGISVYTIAVNATKAQKLQMLNRSSDCPSGHLIWNPSSGRWSVDNRVCAAPADRMYAKEATPAGIAGVFQNIVDSITHFDVTIGGQTTHDLTVGTGRTVQLPADFVCRPGAAQDFAISVQTFTGIQVRASEASLTMCRL